MADLDLRPLRASDLSSLARCHARVFGEVGARSEAALRWATLDNPSGSRAFVAVDGAEVVAAYLGRATRTWIAGEARSFVQSTDSMVDPAYRAGLKRPGLFVNLARAYFDHFGIRGSDAVHYGWPIESAWRIGERFLEYRLLREELVLVRELGAEDEPGLPEGVVRLEDFGEDLRWLWDRCAGRWGAATIRDADWARWRFLQHPEASYAALGVRDGDGVLRGLAVVREGEWSWPGAVPLCDWLVPDEEPEVARLLERAVRGIAREAGAGRVVALVPDWSATFALLQEHAWRAQPSPYRQAARSFDRRFDLEWLRRGWWSTLADSDLA
jgi:hypothetical protein